MGAFTGIERLEPGQLLFQYVESCFRGIAPTTRDAPSQFVGWRFGVQDLEADAKLGGQRAEIIAFGTAQEGGIDDPRLPPNSFDRIFMVHMYHEVTEPYAFIWRLRSAANSARTITRSS